MEAAKSFCPLLQETGRAMRKRPAEVVRPAVVLLAFMTGKHVVGFLFVDHSHQTKDRHGQRSQMRKSSGT